MVLLDFPEDTCHLNWLFYLAVQLWWVLIQSRFSYINSNQAHMLTHHILIARASVSLCVVVVSEIEWQINIAQKVRTFVFVVTMLLGNKSYTVGKPVYFPFKWCHICKEHAFVG